MLLNCGVGGESWEFLGQQGNPNSQTYVKSVLNIHWNDWYWSWNSKPLATWCKEMIHWKRPWCWERLQVGEGDNREWDGWTASRTQWTLVWVSSDLGDGQGSLVCCSPWGCKHSYNTEWLNWIKLIQFVR